MNSLLSFRKKDHPNLEVLVDLWPELPLEAVAVEAEEALEAVAVPVICA